MYMTFVTYKHKKWKRAYEIAFNLKRLKLNFSNEMKRNFCFSSDKRQEKP